jgi:molybdopterin converting factor small subunit
MSDIVIEFFAIPRARAGRAELRLSAGSVREALAGVMAHCPRLAGLLSPDGRLNPGYLVALGEAFVADLDAPLRPGDRLMLLSADAGG